MLVCHVDALTQTLHLKLFTRATAVDILDIICGGLEVASSIVALGDEDVVFRTSAGGLIYRNRGTLMSVSVYISYVFFAGVWPKTIATHHELLLDLSEAVDTRLELEVVVGSGLGNSGNDGDPVALGADIVCGRDGGNVNICVLLANPLIHGKRTRTYRSCGRPATGE